MTSFDQLHPLLQALIADLPPAGSVWSYTDRQRWLAAMSAALVYCYPDAKAGPIGVIEQPASQVPAGSNGAAEDSRPVAAAPAAPIDAPDPHPAAGEAGDGAPGRGNGHAPSGSGPSSPPPKDRPALATVSAEPPDDPRVISEDCRKCGQRFTWQPALVNHERTCRGEMATA